MMMTPTSSTRMGFEGLCWRFVEKKSTFAFSNWNEEKVQLFLSPFGFCQGKELLVLTFQKQSLVVQAVQATGAPNAQSATKHRIDMTVRLLDDVRKAHLYFTAAPQRNVCFFVDSKEEFDQIVRFASEALQLPVAVPVLSPRSAMAAAGESPGSAPATIAGGAVQQSTANVNVNQIIDEAFAALSSAQDCVQANNLRQAVTWYSKAEAGFGKSQAVVTEPRMQQLFAEKRREIIQTIRRVRDQIKSQSGGSTPSSSSPRNPAPSPAPVPPPPALAQGNALALDLPPAPGDTLSNGDQQTQTLDERLRRLQILAQVSPTSHHEPAPVVQVQPLAQSLPGPISQPQQDTAMVDKLKSRLQALKKESSQPTDKRDLCDRLGNLRQGNDPADVASSVTAATLLAPVPTDPVQSIISQVNDEIRLGIKDDEVDEDDFSESVDSDHSDVSFDSDDEIVNPSSKRLKEQLRAKKSH